MAQFQPRRCRKNWFGSHRLYEMPHLSLQLLGNSLITRDEVSITHFRSDKARALLFFLTLEAERAQTREHLCGMFWGELSETNARHNLSQAIFYLQQALGKTTVERLLDISRATLQFKRDDETYVDAHEFSDLLRSTENHIHKNIESCATCLTQLERACALYRGELLAQFFVDDCPAFEEWLLVRREQFQRRALGALAHLTAFYEAQGPGGSAGAMLYARRQIELEPWHEEPYRVLMRTLSKLNQGTQALAEYHALTNVLHQELGLEPSAETNALYKYLHAARQTTDIKQPAIERDPQDYPSNLPLPPTPLVGRTTELAQLGARLQQSDCRLLTLIGEGGIGKTRLAIQTALNRRSAYPCGTYFIDLADVTAPEMIPHALAAALQFNFSGANSPAQQITEHLKDAPEPMLVVMDNFEQIVSGAPFLSAMLKRAPRVTMLVTSREPLNLEGEWLFPVEGLDAPANLPAQLGQDWDTSDALRLLVQCAIHAHIDPQKWSDRDKSAAIRITQMVEGMPLAIELASGWLRTLTPVEIAQEIARGLDVFSSTRRDLPARHASIRAVFEHSWVLLSDTEREVFARLAIFRGGITREAAREIAGASLQTLSSLVDKSLVKRAAAGRYRLHELVRQFAAEKLHERERETGTIGETEARHTAYYLNLVTSRAPSFNAAGAQEVLEDLRHDLDNVRQAWRAASRSRELGLLASALENLAEFYAALALYQEGLTELEFAQAQLDLEDGSPALGLASRLLAQQARMATYLTRHEEAIARARRAITLGERVESVEGITAGYLYWGFALRRQGNYAGAREILENAVVRAQTAQLGNLEWEARMSLGGTFWNESSYEAAREHWERALTLTRAQGNQRAESLLLNNLALLFQEKGDFVTSRDYLNQAFPLAKLVGTDKVWGSIVVNLGLVDIDQGAFDAAREHLEQGLYFFREIQGHWQENLALLGLGQLAFRLGEMESARTQLETAAQLLGAIHAQTDEARGLGLLGLVYHSLGQPERADAALAKGIAVAREIGDRFTLGKNLLILGHLRADGNDLEAAQRAYAEALTLLTQLELKHLQAEGRAGLAHVSFVRGVRATALEQVEWLVRYLGPHALDGADEPVRVWLTCWEILRALDPARAGEILDKAHAMLMQYAASIQATETRRSFLENVAAHRELVRLWTRS